MGTGLLTISVTLTKNLATLCPPPGEKKKKSKVELKGNGLGCQAEAVSQQVTQVTLVQAAHGNSSLFPISRAVRGRAET